MLALVTLVAPACGGGDDDDASTDAGPGVVLVDDNVFKPKEATVAVGATVTWRFEGSSQHNVSFDDFHSELMKKGEFEHTFDEAGTFSYKCTIHTGMTGKVIVE